MTLDRCRGFTLVEVMVVIVILGVMAALAVPSYRSTVEVARGNEAKTNLNIIHMGEKLYYLNNGSYWGPGATTVAAVNSGLNVDMSAVYYTTVSVTGAAGNYTARFTRNNVAGGSGTKYFEATFATGASAPTVTEGGSY
jgi:prepilin-type N-terminal cleavage/methylation domain-containing protein